jgi:hypothetical protein
MRDVTRGTSLRLPALVLLAAPFVACSSDGGPKYPAFGFDFPQLQDGGGVKLTRPNVVILMQANDRYRPEIAAATSYVASHDYWHTVTAEYGIDGLGDVTIVAPPAAFAAAFKAKDLESYVATYVRTTRFAGAPAPGAGTSGTATLHADTLYVVALPNTTTITDMSCGTGGFHRSVLATATDEVPYAVTRADCSNQPPDGFTPSEILLHEMIESATDPFPDVQPGIFGSDHAHVAWDFFEIEEVADMCVGAKAQIDGDPPVLVNVSNSTPLVFPGIWSNRRAALGQNPCVPMSAKQPPALAVASADLPKQITVNDTVVAPGALLALGATATIPVRVATDRASGPVTLLAVDVASTFHGKPVELAVSLDRTSAQNGDVVHLTLTRQAMPMVYSNAPVSAFAIIAESQDALTFPTFGVVGLPPP